MARFILNHIDKHYKDINMAKEIAFFKRYLAAEEQEFLAWLEPPFATVNSVAIYKSPYGKNYLSKKRAEFHRMKNANRKVSARFDWDEEAHGENIEVKKKPANMLDFVKQIRS